MLDWRLIVLSLGNFVIGTGSLMLPGMLNELAADLGRPAHELGILVAMSLLAGGLSAPFLAIASSRMNRRTVLATALLVSAASHFSMAFAGAFALLVLARGVTGIAGAVLTPQVAGAAGVLVPPERRGAAIATGLLGYNVAGLLGVPAGVLLAGAFGWRTSFLIIGALTLVCVVLVRAAIPARLPVTPLDRRAWGELFANRAIVLSLGFYFVHFAAHITLFSYIAPLLLDSIGADASLIAALLVWYGGIGLATSITTARFMDRLGPVRVIACCLAMLVLAMLLWPLGRGSVPATMGVLAVMATGGYPLGGAQQVWLSSLDHRLATVSVAFSSSVAYLGAAVGALLGSQLIARLGYGSVSWASAGLYALSAFLLLAMRAAARRSTRRA